MAAENASSSVAEIIKLESKLRCHDRQKAMLEYVEDILEGVPHRVKKSYSLLLLAARQVCVEADKIKQCVQFTKMIQK